MKFFIIVCALLPLIYASKEWFDSPSEGLQIAKRQAPRHVDEIPSGEVESASEGDAVVKREIPSIWKVLWKSAFPEISDEDVVDVEN